ncbi:MULTISPECIES: cation diffusion facilitator family transporter [Myroides]|uniref:Cation diffusion facilitator family transporter n=1 Tax=Myroides albus TaxID=2562892 RepID=A0A6I3LJJ8_9FLAO|nr:MULTISPECIES: cation diffusion facilitator family transporter [Myroides]MTG98017.1 cation diffusion facilitator family transporter [Myroides albus]MVX35926.1 cation diffusion facilitator family transporter [Myroides sp. LoEW2-1]UVD80309.1 cation diffusion facilitator family transporter [Myroides albus]
MNTKAKDNYQFQKIIAAVGVLLFVVKIIAWSITHSVAILTDALESVTNVVSGFIGLYSLYLSSLPRDRNHPYGHGKVEFISATIEGGLIIMAGVVIIFEAVRNFLDPQPIGQLDYGILLVGITAIVNYVLGWYAIRKGSQNKSLALIASGKHLQSDTYSTIGIIIGLVLLYFTGYQWLDGGVALIFAGIIIVTGYKIVRGAISGIMDETDELLLEEVIAYLQEHRRANWIDLHNLRIIKYGSVLHFDCHMTVPWYFTIVEGHKEVEILEREISEKFGTDLELFVHMDDCKSFSCKICTKEDCPFRSDPFEKQIEWNRENVLKNKRHNSPTQLK